MISNIVFDMGRVLIQWNADLLLGPYQLTGQDREILIRELFGSVEWVQTDRGTLSGEEAARAVCRRTPARLHEVIWELATGWWKQPLQSVGGMDALIRELKAQGYGIYLLSNASRDLRRYFHRLPGADCFDGAVVSAEEGLLKPQPEIYRVLLRRYQLEAETCFFIDDLPANVEGAIQEGLGGTVFRGDVGLLRRQLRQAGIRCGEA